MAAATALVKREFDVVVMGATGFSGKLLAEYLVKNYIGSVKIALAGRSKEKLEDVRRRFLCAQRVASTGMH